MAAIAPPPATAADDRRAAMRARMAAIASSTSEPPAVHSWTPPPQSSQLALTPSPSPSPQPQPLSPSSPEPHDRSSTQHHFEMAELNASFDGMVQAVNRAKDSVVDLSHREAAERAGYFGGEGEDGGEYAAGGGGDDPLLRRARALVADTGSVLRRRPILSPSQLAAAARGQLTRPYEHSAPQPSPRLGQFDEREYQRQASPGGEHAWSTRRSSEGAGWRQAPPSRHQMDLQSSREPPPQPQAAATEGFMDVYVYQQLEAMFDGMRGIMEQELAWSKGGFDQCLEFEKSSSAVSRIESRIQRVQQDAAHANMMLSAAQRKSRLKKNKAALAAISLQLAAANNGVMMAQDAILGRFGNPETFAQRVLSIEQHVRQQYTDMHGLLDTMQQRETQWAAELVQSARACKQANSDMRAVTDKRTLAESEAFSVRQDNTDLLRDVTDLRDEIELLKAKDHALDKDERSKFALQNQQIHVLLDRAEGDRREIERLKVVDSTLHELQTELRTCADENDQLRADNDQLRTNIVELMQRGGGGGGVSRAALSTQAWQMPVGGGDASPSSTHSAVSSRSSYSQIRPDDSRRPSATSLILCKGYLHKRKTTKRLEGMRSWDKRYFVLTRNSMSYYEGKKQYDLSGTGKESKGGKGRHAMPLGVIPLKGAMLELRGPAKPIKPRFELEAVMQGKAVTFRFEAPSAQDAERWVALLETLLEEDRRSGFMVAETGQAQQAEDEAVRRRSQNMQQSQSMQQSRAPIQVASVTALAAASRLSYGQIEVVFNDREYFNPPGPAGIGVDFEMRQGDVVVRDVLHVSATTAALRAGLVCRTVNNWKVEASKFDEFLRFVKGEPRPISITFDELLDGDDFNIASFDSEEDEVPASSFADSEEKVVNTFLARHGTPVAATPPLSPKLRKAADKDAKKQEKAAEKETKAKAKADKKGKGSALVFEPDPDGAEWDARRKQLSGKKHFELKKLLKALNKPAIGKADKMIEAIVEAEKETKNAPPSPAKAGGGQVYKVLSMTIIRAGIEKSSKYAGKLENGGTITAIEVKKNKEGKERVHFEEGKKKGWVSVISGKGESILQLTTAAEVRAEYMALHHGYVAPTSSAATSSVSVFKKVKKPDPKEETFECDNDCGFEHADEKVVEQHEASCTHGKTPVAAAFMKAKKPSPAAAAEAPAKPLVYHTDDTSSSDASTGSSSYNSADFDRWETRMEELEKMKPFELKKILKALGKPATVAKKVPLMQNIIEAEMKAEKEKGEAEGPEDEKEPSKPAAEEQPKAATPAPAPARAATPKLELKAPAAASKDSIAPVSLETPPPVRGAAKADAPAPAETPPPTRMKRNVGGAKPLTTATTAVSSVPSSVELIDDDGSEDSFPALPGEAGGASGVSSASSSAAAAEDGQETPIPMRGGGPAPNPSSPWAAYKDAEGDYYYSNGLTGETSWELPQIGCKSYE